MLLLAEAKAWLLEVVPRAIENRGVRPWGRGEKKGIWTFAVGNGVVYLTCKFGPIVKPDQIVERFFYGGPSHPLCPMHLQIDTPPVAFLKNS